MKEPEATDSLLEGFKELIGDIVPAVATAAVEPSIKTAHKQWAADLSNVAKEMQAQLDASLLSIESTFASVSQQLSATADGFENAVSSEKQGLWQALGEYRQETERIAAELSSFAEAASKAVSDSENFAVQLADVVKHGDALASRTSSLLAQQEDLNTQMDAISKAMVHEVDSIHKNSEAIINDLAQAIATLKTDFSAYQAQLRGYTESLDALMQRAVENFEKARGSLLFGMSPRGVLAVVVLLHVLEIAAAVLYFRFYVYTG